MQLERLVATGAEGAHAGVLPDIGARELKEDAVGRLLHDAGVAPVFESNLASPSAPRPGSA